MRKILTAIFWSIQINLAMWLLVAALTGFQNVAVIIGLAIGAILEHIAVRHLRPEIRSLRPAAG